MTASSLRAMVTWYCPSQIDWGWGSAPLRGNKLQSVIFKGQMEKFFGLIDSRLGSLIIISLPENEEDSLKEWFRLKKKSNGKETRQENIRTPSFPTKVCQCLLSKTVVWNFTLYFGVWFHVFKAAKFSCTII